MSAVRRAMSAEAREHLGSVTVEGIEPITLWSCPSNIRNPPVVQMNSDPDGEQNDGNPHSWPQPSRKADQDRKSTRLNSSHGYISYAVFCLKKKKNTRTNYSERQ